MAFTKTVKQVEYHVEIIKKLEVPQWLLTDVKRMFLNEGKIAAIKKLRWDFNAHYGETMYLRDAKEIVEDMVKEFGMETRQFYHGYEGGEKPDEPSLGDILAAALKQ